MMMARMTTMMVVVVMVTHSTMSTCHVPCIVLTYHLI